MVSKATATAPAPNAWRILRMPEAVSKSGLSRGSIYRLMKIGQFPKSVKLSERAIGWREADIDDWLASRQHAA